MISATTRRKNQEVLDALPAEQDKALFPSKVFERLEGWDRDSVSRRLSELFRLGLCRRVGTQGKSRYYLGGKDEIVPEEETSPRKRFSKDDDGMLIELRQQGLSAEEIANSMRLDASLVFSRLQQIGGQESKPSRDGSAKKVAPRSGMTRCLWMGCGKQFFSEDKCRVRFCPSCKRKRSDYSDSGLPDYFEILL